MLKKSFPLMLLFLVSTFFVPVWAQKIGFLLDSYVMDRWYLDHKFFEEKVKSLGGTCRVENPFGDPSQQVKIGKKMIDEGVEVLVIVPIDAEMAIELVEYARSKMVPVISYDRLINSDKITAYIGYNSEKVGKMEAEYLVKLVPEGNYVLINGPKSDNNAILQRKGQMEVLKPFIDAGKIKLIGDIVQQDWSEIETLIKFDEFMTNSTLQPDAIIAGNDVLANGAIEVLPKELWGKVKIAGQDADITAIKNIIAGSQSVTIYKPIKPLAELAAETAMNIKKGKSANNYVPFQSGNITVNALLLDPYWVYKENINETVLKDGHVNISQIYQKN